MAGFGDIEAWYYEQLYTRYATSVEGRLTLSDLFKVMQRFAPPLFPEAAKNLMYHYDTSCTGRLSFEDFLRLLEGLKEYLDEQRTSQAKALQCFREKVIRGGCLVLKDLRGILMAGNGSLSRRDVDTVLTGCFGETEGVVASDGLLELFDTAIRRIGGTVQGGWVDHPTYPSPINPPLERTLEITIVSATGLEEFARTKHRRHRFLYQSLDPYITIHGPGSDVQETTILFGTLHPEWNLTLAVRFQLPSTDPTSVWHWIDAQRVKFHLWDYSLEGVTARSEWLSTATLSLANCLRCTEGPPKKFALRMHAPTLSSPGTGNAVLEVAARTAGGSDSFSLAALTTQPDEEIMTQHTKELERDLLLTSPLRMTRDDLDCPETAEEQEKARGPPSFFEHYQNVLRLMLQRFRRRRFRILAWDEARTLRPLMTFIRPIHSYRPGTQKNLAEKVAQIGLPSNPCGRGEPLVHDEVWSPATVLLHKKASPLEQAILLCDVFLGQGIVAFVCLGELNGTLHPWVVTLDGPRPPTPKQLATYSFSQRDLVAWEEDHNHARQRVRAGLFSHAIASHAVAQELERPIHPLEAHCFKNLCSKISSDDGIQVHHWDPMFGVTREAGSPGFTFDRVGCIFNQWNIYFNVQTTDNAAKLRWDVLDSSQWLPFLTREIATTYGPPECWYSSPSALLTPPLPPSSTFASHIVKGLADAISEYRCCEIFIPETRFYRPACEYLQTTLSSWNGEGDPFTHVAENVNTQVPGHCVWHGRAFQFLTTNITEIMERLIWTGILDCSVPQVLYAIGALPHRHSWGLDATCVFVGFLVDAYQEITR